MRGTFNSAICRALTGVGHAVRVVSPRSWIEVLRTDRHRKHGDSRSAALPGEFRVTYPCYFYPPKMLRNNYGRFMWLSARSAIERLYREFSPDCVVSYWAHPDGEVGLRAAELAGVPSAVIVGGSDVLLLTKSLGRRKQVLNVLHGSDAVITVSEGLRQNVIDLGIPAEKVHTVYQGVDAEFLCQGSTQDARQRLGLPLNKNVLLWVGRMVPVKGLEVLLAACSELNRHGMDFQLQFVGGGPLRESVQSEVNQRGLSGSINFAGEVPHDKLPDWYRAADATVISSWSEGLPNVLRESLACGTPFVATDVGSIAEIADANHSLLVPAGDADALANAIANMLADKSFRKSASRYCPRSWNDSANSLAEVLQTLPRQTTNRDSSHVRQLELVEQA